MVNDDGWLWIISTIVDDSGNGQWRGMIMDGG